MRELTGTTFCVIALGVLLSVYGLLLPRTKEAYASINVNETKNLEGVVKGIYNPSLSEGEVEFSLYNCLYMTKDTDEGTELMISDDLNILADPSVEILSGTVIKDTKISVVENKDLDDIKININKKKKDENWYENQTLKQSSYLMSKFNFK